MMSRNQHIIGMLLSLALMVGMMPVFGLTQTAYAEDGLIAYELYPTEEWNNSEDLLTVDDLPGFKEGTLEEAQTWTGAQRVGGTVLIYGQTGDDWLVALFQDGEYQMFDTKHFTKGFIRYMFISGSKFYYMSSTLYPLWVDGVQVTSSNASDVLAKDPDNAGKVSFTPAMGDTPATLTLNGANISSGEHNNAGIYYADADNELVIDATTASTVTGPNYGYNSYGILSDGDLTINGELTATGGNFNSEYIDNPVTYSYGIYGKKALTINKGAKVTANGGSSLGSSYGITAAALTVNGELIATGITGIKSDNGVIIKDGAKVTATGGTTGAITGTVKNAITGIGWTDTAGTQGKTDIAVSETGQDLSSYKKVQFPAVLPHFHSFTYSAEGATITATCTSEGCSLPEVGGKHEATLTIAVPLHTTYGDGKDATAQITDENSIKGAAEVEYYNATKSGEAYTKTGDALIAAPTNAGNYVAEVTLGADTNKATASVGYTIAPKSVTVSGITANDKEYDGNTDAALNYDSAVISGIVDEDKVTLSTTEMAGTFSDKDVAEDKTVTISGLALTGDDSANYILDAQPTAIADITAKKVIVSGIEASGKTYDGTTDATLDFSKAVFDGKLDTDTLTVTANGVFEDANSGTGKTVNISGLTLGGDSKGNYTLASDGQQTTALADIAQKSIVGATVTLDKTQLTYSGQEQSVSVTGVETSDGMTLAATDYEVVTGNKGTEKGDYTVTIMGIGNFTDRATAGWKIVEKVTPKPTPTPKKPQTVGKTTVRNTIANSAKKTNDVIYDAVPGATGYDIAYKHKNSSKWIIKKVGKKTRATVSGFSVKGIYQFKVRAKKAETAKYKAATGAWSPVIYRYFHTTEKIRLASKAKRSFTMSWKKNPQATSYQVMFSTNKNGAGAAKNINTVGKNATSFTKVGLKSGKTYYVQVREIVKIGNKNYIGNISCPVAVKVK